MVPRGELGKPADAKFRGFLGAVDSNPGVPQPLDQPGPKGRSLFRAPSTRDLEDEAPGGSASRVHGRDAELGTSIAAMAAETPAEKAYFPSSLVLIGAVMATAAVRGARGNRGPVPPRPLDCR